jgi:O-antigen/teichoic acid export membrane protein
MQFIAFNVTLGGIGVLTSLAGGSRLLTFLYGAEYARHTTAFTCVMIASALNYASSAFGFAATSLRSFKPQPWILATSTLVLLVATQVLVPQFGITGAAIATICSTFTCLCGYVALVTWKLA